MTQDTKPYTVEAPWLTLSDVVRDLAALAPKKPSLESLTLVDLQIKDNELVLRTTDLETIAICQIPVECGPGAKIDARVNVHNLTSILRPGKRSKANGKTVEIMQTEKNLKILVDGLTSVVQMSDIEREDLPSIPDITGEKDILYCTSSDCEELLKDLKWIEAAISNDPDRPMLNTVLLDSEKARIVATDGHRMHLVEFSGFLKDLEKKILYPKVSMRFLMRILKKAYSLGLKLCNDTEKDKDTVLTAILNKLDATWTIYTKPVDATYPDIDRVVPDKNEERIAFFDAATILKCLKRMDAMKCENAMQFDIEAEEVSLKSKDENGHETMFIATVTGKIEKFDFALNRRYLQEAIMGMKNHDLEIYLPENNLSAFRITRGDNSFAIIMPMRY